MTNTNKEQTLRESLRLFQCARCFVQVTICTYCDRGNIYCSQSCSKLARIASRCAASKRYQQTLCGKQNHARCQQRYREKLRGKIKAEIDKVIDQGSASNPRELCFPTIEEVSFSHKAKHLACDFCGRRRSAYMRQSFLNHYRRRKVTLPFSSMAFAQGP